MVNAILSFPQTTNYINGKVINSVTHASLPFATVILKENKLGVFTNADGDFRIIRDPKFQSDSVIITCIGFKRTGVSFQKLNNVEINKIYLIPATYSLGEIKVVASRRKLSAETIIRRAINNINQNYPKKPFNYISYYRDYQKKDKNYINLNEAIVQTLDSGFSQISTLDKYRLLDFRLNIDFQRMNISPFYDTIFSTENDCQNKFIKYAKLPDQGGNELFILMVHDPIRNFQTGSFSFVNNFSKDFIANHVFLEITHVYNNNLILYKISFKAKPLLTGDSLKILGEIYIQPKDYSIHKLVYSGYYVSKGNADRKMFNIDVEYGYENSIGSIMCLKYISFNNIFNLVDNADTTYFRVINSHLDTKDRSNSTLIFEFNNAPDIKSASNKDCYEVFFEDKKVKIININVVDNKAIIKVKPENMTSPKITVAVRNIIDKKGNILNKKKNLEFYQYRELFVQEYNKTLSLNDSCFMQNIPLIQNCISKYMSDKTYWMNTPINIKTDK
jgi:hypothetical protein